MIRRVLLVRPHDFLVDDMQAFLLALGLEPVRLNRLEELEREAGADVAGVVVSSAATSAVSASVGEAVRAVRRVLPKAPLVLAGLAGHDALATRLRDEVPELRFEALRPGEPLAARAGQAHQVVLLRREDLGTQAAAALVRAHLGVG